MALQLTLLRHGRQLSDYVARLMPPTLGIVVDPVDVVQDVYLEAMRRSAEFRPTDDDHVRRWLKTIARHRVVDLVRYHDAGKRGRAVTMPAAQEPDVDDSDTIGLLEQVAVYHRTPSQSAAAHEMVALVNRSIDDLPDDYGQVLRLLYLQGLSGKAVAAQLARTERSVNNLCARAISALRLRLRSSHPPAPSDPPPPPNDATVGAPTAAERRHRRRP